MSNDLISRSALISEFEWLKSVVNESGKDEINDTIQRIQNAPAVDAAPVVHAHWIVDEADSGEPGGYPAFIEFHCPVCNESYSLENGEYGWSYGDDIPFKFCHECSAKMDINYPGLVVGSEREKKLKRFLEENELPVVLNTEEDVLIVDVEADDTCSKEPNQGGLNHE